MKTKLSRLAIVVTLSCLMAAAGYAAEEKNAMEVRGGKLHQGLKEFVMHGIETPDVAKPGNDLPTIAKILARVSEVGANTVCFDLGGLSADGKTLAPDVPKTIAALMEQVTWRRMTAICRIFGPGASKDASFRTAAIDTVANALNKVDRVVYWIDGPDSGKLADAFHKVAPNLTVASEQNGNLLVTATAPKDAKQPVLLVGGIPAPELLDTVHFVLPGDDASYKTLDVALANPAESKPSTPDNSVLSEKERADGFISLFDGKSLDGWWTIGKNKEGFGVTDGTIEWKSLGGAGLYTRDRYDNFVLRLDWKIRKNGNSGVYIRAPRVNRQSKIGMEIQLQGDSGTPCNNQTTCAVYDVVPPTVNAAKPEGEWNTEEITANGPSLKVVLNGQTVQDLNLDQNEELKVRLRRGFIGLQDHGNYVAFRNLRIKKL